MADGETIVDLAVATPDLSTLVEAVQAAGLAETLSGEGPFTVFAPTNEAFAAIPAATLESILADTELLTKILTYHVVAGEFPASAVAELPDVATGAEVATVEGQNVTIVASDAGVTVNGANVVQADVEASNGVVHVIDQVILPPDVQL
ncbi:MAG TPA: fasciclin domain-containing protein [Acidimicrobiia bacterium]|nr:fasciclin domain-containing protein [Acidimicrobiia bacterium]